ncbi:MAG: AAA family ATPase [Treponema sp.]|nr:AAA family ATPase [Treponema sp.]
MKPVKLYMKNIGPYLNEAIDFTKLDNMFLIKGDTGAGKTFIFDSITFALYGVLRGNRKGHEADFKSRYAEESDESFVEFTFEVGGRRYKINRSVPFAYTNRNGNVSKKIQEVSLEELTEGSAVIFPGKLTEINEKVHQIIGLSADEFAQIVVLPQGEFAEFLHKNTNERMKTLEKLFPVEFYSNITQKIKDRYEVEKGKLHDFTAIIDSLSKGKDFSRAEEEISRMTSEIEELTQKENILLEKKTELAKNLENLKRDRFQAQEYEENCRKLENLESQKEDFENLEKIIFTADKAKGLREFIRALDISEKDLTAAERDYSSACEREKSLQKLFASLEEKKAEMSLLKEKNEKDGQDLKLLQDKVQKAGELEQLKAEEAASLARKVSAEEEKSLIREKKLKINEYFQGKSPAALLSEISEKVSELTQRENLLENEKEDCINRDELLKKIEDCRKSLEEGKGILEKEEEKAERTKKTLEALEEEKKAAEEKHQAYAVSSFLIKGRPCPVCGSLEHPCPAKKPEGLLDYGEQIKTNKENLESLEKLCREYKENVTRLESNLNIYEEELAKIPTKRELSLVEEELASLKKEIEGKKSEEKLIQEMSRNLENLDEELRSAEENFNKENIHHSSILARIDSLEKTLGEDIEAIRTKAEKIEGELSQNKKAYDQWEENYNQTSRDYSGAQSYLSKSRGILEEAKNKFADAENLLKEKLSLSEFTSIEEAKKANLDDSQLEEKRRSLSQYREELKSVRDAVNSAKEKKTGNLEEIEKKFQAADLEEKELAGLYEENKNLLASKRDDFNEYKNTYGKIQDAQNNKVALEKEIQPLAALNDNLSGKNPQKLQLESWALGMYFEQVVDFASRRFNDISDGRFFFKLKEAQDQSRGNGFRGLDLQVFDTHNGKTSDPAELSGGETFEASISLALAITDVVQNNNGGGIQLDSLFIDEGFGTLDPETLDKAMAVLTELGESKMIGMISHVSEMESYPGINSSITVKKSNTGSSVKVE